jgi:FKBP-type peptidyl-prolyl cis-trans isomerase SlyD
LGKSAGDTFDFLIDAENGYGLSDSQSIVPVPVNAFAGENGQYEPELLKVGAVLQMMDQDGNNYEGEIKEVNVDHVLMDFNHPLSDKQLHFIGEVVAVRQATLEELQHGHVHDPGGHHH